MYRAKTNRAGVVSFDPTAPSRDAGDVSMVAQLRWAVRRGELRLHYQPQLDLGTGRFTGVEALLRWQHPTRGLLPPAAFLPAAERSDVMLDVTWQVLAMATEQAQRWRHEGLPLQVALNLSALCLADEDLPGRLRGIVGDVVPPDTLTLEITETALVAEPERAARTLQGLARTGFRLSLDDFGSGFTSFTSLRDVAMNSASPRKTASWLFLQWVTGQEHLLRAAVEFAAVDPARRSVAEHADFRRAMGAHRDYLATVDAVRDHTRVLFTPQLRFFEATASWAAALRDVYDGADAQLRLDVLSDDCADCPIVRAGAAAAGRSISRRPRQVGPIYPWGV